jgi:hypothetical protein
VRLVFWIMVVVFIIIILSMFTGGLFAGRVPFGYIIFPAFVIFVGLGIALIVLTVKKRPRGIRKTFLILTGASAVGIPVFAVLHNLVYALLILIFGEDVWGSLGDEPVFFTLAVIVCPVAFLVGAVGTIVLAVRDRLIIAAGAP